ncbi:Receptor-like serine/threonine-protein kinase [Apostasia shenzhenica]|uniref:Receptor-like serine/threonine-protein kinase n=1 Tax=Apostasia shenzhenica TaxID=1088818 RepID=A0A2I0AWU8_9ASPA|nr:Receptor-like serine/threonine-protein kinase [Apostasia shenzhenica]
MLDPLPPPPAAIAFQAAVRHHRHHDYRPHHLSPPMMIIAALAATIAALAAASLAVIFYRRFFRGRAAPTVPSDANPLRRFSFSQLRRATSSFCLSHKLGQGGFGPVYRGSLSSGQPVAVKLMDSGSLQGEREFQNELSLAAKILTMGSSPDRGWVVVPVGFCNCEKYLGWWGWPWRRRRGKDLEATEMALDDDCESASSGRRLLLVYELMHNGSLQDALLDRRCPELMDWRRRFSVAVDIAHGIHFLHSICDPPIIHGDIKPSNILLDSHLSAKVADFGLARFKLQAVDGLSSAAGGSHLEDEDPTCEIDRKSSPSIWRNGGGGEDDASATGETVESTTSAGDKCQEEDDGFAARVLEVDVASTSEAVGFDRASIDSGRDTLPSSSRRNGRRKGGAGGGGKDWWWRQDGGGGGGGGNSESGVSVKDYVMEWIRSEIKKERPKSDWITADGPEGVAGEVCLPDLNGKTERKQPQRKLEWWASLDDVKSRKKSRPAREWWREEFCEELTKKSKWKAIVKTKSNLEGAEQQWWQSDGELQSPLERKKMRTKKSWTKSSHTSVERRIPGRRSSRDCASSTPSMRGTVCYVAPEYGGGGPLSEKCDIYSFGVLLLVIVSGRRPLQVTASPMSEFERANLISWARQLAHIGRLFDLVDPSLQAVDREQALLCITIALLCIQRLPYHRPSIKEILEMLTGQSEPPHLPLEFSPSPPGGFSLKSKRKALR